MIRQTRPAQWADEDWCDEHADRIADEMTDGLRDERGYWIGEGGE